MRTFEQHLLQRINLLKATNDMDKSYDVWSITSPKLAELTQLLVELRVFRQDFGNFITESEKDEKLTKEELIAKLKERV